MTDPIADFLTRIRNAIHAAHETVQIPASKLKTELARILVEQGYIDSWSVTGAGWRRRAGDRDPLKYTADRRSAIAGLKRVSRPGQRTYVQAGGIRRCWGDGDVDRLDLAGRDDRPRRTRGGRRRRGSGAGLVAQARGREKRRESGRPTPRCPGSENNQSPCRAA